MIRYVEKPKILPVAAPANATYASAISAIDCQNNIYRHANQAINRDQNIDYIAPGVDIYSSVPLNIDPTGYGIMSGTSMAAPFITGLLVLLWQKYPNKDASFILNQLHKGFSSKSKLDKDKGRGMPTAP